MAITIIVEDGSIVSDANSYDSVANIRAFLLSRGEVLSDDDDVVAAQILKSMDYLIQYNAYWKGCLVSPGVQSLAWPRQDVYFDRVLWAKDQIPDDLKRGLAYLVLAVSKGTDLMPTTDGGREQFVIERTVGPITRKWSEGIAANSSSTPTVRAADAFFASLLANTGTRTRAYRV